MNKEYRFFYHYRRSDKKMSVHFKGQCVPCDDIICNVPCETKRNKIQPYLVIQGYCREIINDNNKVVIN